MTLSAVRPSVLLECAECQKDFRKDRREYDRQVRAGRSKFYCGLSCSGKNSNRVSPRINPISHFKGIKYIRLEDELSPFRYYTRKARLRFPPTDETTVLTEAYLMQLWSDQDGRCALTGLKLVLNKGHKGTNDLRTVASLDRINSAYPYQIGNVQFVSASMNFAKSSMSNADMTEFIAAIRSGKDLC